MIGKESIDYILKKALGWSLILMGLFMYLIICIEWTTCIRFITPKEPGYAILVSVLIYTIIPFILGFTLLIRLTNKERFLDGFK